MNSAFFAQNRRFQIWVVVIGILLMGIKFFAWGVTNSNAILTDAIESIINVAAGFFALYSISLTAKPKDENHPYGHGKIEFIAAGFEGGLIAVAGLLIVLKSVYNLVYPQVLEQIDFGLAITAFSGFINFGLGAWMVRRGKISRSLTVQSEGRHLLSDAYSSVGILVGMGLLWLTGAAWLDSATAIVFGFFILYTGYKLLRSAVSGIMDEADPEVIQHLVNIMERNRRVNWVDIHNLRVIRYGADIHVDCHLTVPWYFSVEQGHEEVKRLEALIQAESPMPVELFIHADPCRPPLACALCKKADCTQRKTPFLEEVPWTLKHLLFPRNHQELE